MSEMNVPIINSMGAGNKLDASRFQVADIYKTKGLPVSKSHERGIKKTRSEKLKVVYSEEQPTRPIEDMASSCRTSYLPTGSKRHKCTGVGIYRAVWHLLPSVGD